MNTVSTPPTDAQPFQEAAQQARQLLAEVGRLFIGPSHVPEQLLIALCAGGHVLLEGVPGVAKTTLAKGFAATMVGSFRRIQFTPDLMPADITGTYVLSSQAQARFELRLGPIFANVVLGDEINRAPAKTQSALLEAMQERQVTIDGETHQLPEPFLVVATQNPAEHAGTYPLPEAQIDRFLLRIVIGYPSVAEEIAMLQRFDQAPPRVRPVLEPQDVFRLQTLAEQVHAEASILDYIVRVVHQTRSHRDVYLGASPRASLALLRAAKARALLDGRSYAVPDDVVALAEPVLAHRIILRSEAQMEGIQASEPVAHALRQVPYQRTHP